MITCIAWVSLIGLVTVLGLLIIVWHFVVWRELKARQLMIIRAKKQLHFNEGLLERTKCTGDYDKANQLLHTHYLIYKVQVMSYNDLLRKPFYVIPSVTLGFRNEKLRSTNKE